MHLPHLPSARRLAACLLIAACAAHATEGDQDNGAEYPAPEAPVASPQPQPPPWLAPDDPDFVGPPAPALPLKLLGERVPPGTMTQLSWYAGDSFTGRPEATPVLVAHGAQPGIRLCITAAIHGDELNGIEMTRQLLFDIDPETLHGSVIGVPIVNLHGFRRGSRYMADRRDLNRSFPGYPKGSAAARLAFSLWSKIIRRCDALVDLHTGSFHRSNLPQLRADLSIPAVRHMTRGFGATAVLNSRGIPASLRRVATDAGIPAVTVEAGEPMRFQPEEVDHGVRALRSLLNHLGMVPRFRLWGAPQPVFYESFWIRVDQGGILTSEVTLGDRVRKGDRLGTVTDPISNRFDDIHATEDGIILGMALNQAVIPGFAAYHIGIRQDEEALEENATAQGASAASGSNETGEAPTEPDQPGPDSVHGTAIHQPAQPPGSTAPADDDGRGEPSGGAEDPPEHID